MRTAIGHTHKQIKKKLLGSLFLYGGLLSPPRLVSPSKISHCAPLEKPSHLVSKGIIGMVQRADVAPPAFIVVQNASIKKVFTREALDNHEQIDLLWGQRKCITSSDSFMGP